MKTRVFIWLLVLIALLFGILMLVPPADQQQGNHGKGGNNNHGKPPVTNGNNHAVNDDITQSAEWKQAEGRADFEKFERLWNRDEIDIGGDSGDWNLGGSQGTEGGCIFASDISIVTATPGRFNTELEDREINLMKDSRVIVKYASGILLSTVSPHYIVVKVVIGSSMLVPGAWEKFVKGRSFYEFNIQDAIGFKIFVSDPQSSSRFVRLSPSAYQIRYVRALIDDGSIKGPHVSDSRDIWHDFPKDHKIAYDDEGYRLVYELTLDNDVLEKHRVFRVANSFDVRKIRYKTPGLGWAFDYGLTFIYRDPKDLGEKLAGMYKEIGMWRFAGFENAEKFLMDTYSNKFTNHLPFVSLSYFYENWVKDYPHAISALQQAKDAIWKMSETDPWNDCFWTKDKMQPFDWKSNEIKNMNRLIDDLNKKAQDK